VSIEIVIHLFEIWFIHSVMYMFCFFFPIYPSHKCESDRNRLQRARALESADIGCSIVSTKNVKMVGALTLQVLIMLYAVMYCSAPSGDGTVK